MDNSLERRQLQRYNPDGVGLHSKMILASYLKIIDISLGGMSFEADRRLNMRKVYSLTLTSQGVVATVRGLIVWCSLTKNIKNTKGDVVPIYKCGMEFTDVSGEDIRKIIDSVNNQKKEIDTEKEMGYVDLSSDFIQLQDKEKLEDFVASLYE